MKEHEKKKRFRISYNSPVVLGYATICLLALIADYLTNGSANNLLFSVYRSSFKNPLTYVRFIGHVFGHVGWSHFMGNMMLFLIVGPLLEEKYGQKNMILMILVTAVITGAVNCLLFPNIQLLGASGVVFACILLSSFTCVQEGDIPLTFILVAVIYIGQQIYDGMFLMDNISNLTHILGGGIGAGFGYIMNRKGEKKYEI